MSTVALDLPMLLVPFWAKVVDMNSWLPVVVYFAGLVGVGWCLYSAWHRSRSADTGRHWRYGVFRVGVVATALSLLGILALNIHTLAIGSGALPPQSELPAFYLLPSFAVLVGLLCAPFGRGVSRVLAVSSALIVLVCWYFFVGSSV
jgi:hypothetical protein